MIPNFDDDNYSFHLDHFDSSQHSNNTTLSSIHKQKIDTLFRSKRQANLNKQRIASSSSNASRQSTVSGVSLHSSQSIRSEKSNQSRHSSSIVIRGPSTSPNEGYPNSSNVSKNKLTNSNNTKQNVSSSSSSSNLRLSSPVAGKSTVSIKQSPITVINVDPSTKNIDQTVVTVNNQVKKSSSETITAQNNGVKVRQQTQQNNQAQAELEQVFGGRDQRQKAFLDTRSAVQAQIEKLFENAAIENKNKMGLQDLHSIPPPPPRAPDPPPPPPPSLTTHPAFRHSSPPPPPPPQIAKTKKPTTKK